MQEGPKPRVVANIRCELGEGPLWHPEARTLFFVDILAGNVHAYTPADGRCRLFTHGSPTAGLTLQRDGSLLLFQDGRISRVGTDGVQKQIIAGLCPGNERFNDVMTDPEGRVFAGSMGGDGKLFRFDHDGRQTQILDGLGVPNGMDFTPDLKQFYFTESTSRHIYSFDYDRASGNISNQRVCIEIPEAEGVPDGLTVDAEGSIWTAIWGGGRLKRYSHEGELQLDIHFSAAQTTAPIFGGEDLSDLYVTSATLGLKAPEPGSAKPNHEGALFAIHLEKIRGRPPFRSRLFGA